MSLCYEDDEEHHLKGGKLVSKHVRVPITDVHLKIIKIETKNLR